MTLVHDLRQAFESLIYATQPYYQHIRVERCGGCEQCAVLRQQYEAARDAYDRACRLAFG